VLMTDGDNKAEQALNVVWEDDDTSADALKCEVHITRAVKRRRGELKKSDKHTLMMKESTP